MSEQLSICCLYDAAPSVRRGAILALFNADPVWMGNPSSFALVDFHTRTETAELWSPSDSSIERSLAGQLLFVYSGDAAAAGPNRSCISIDEAAGRAVYTLSFPLSLLRGSSIADIEHRFIQIYIAAESFGACGVFIGAELEVDSTQSKTEAMSAAFDSFSLVSWIIANEDDLPNEVMPFKVALRNKHRALLRHADASSRVGLTGAAASSQ
jgi:hypothetical protein